MKDPTNTGSLQRAFGRAVRTRLLALGQEIIKKIVTEDALGHQNSLSFMLNAQDWKYHNNPQKLEAFRLWLQARIDAGLLSVDTDGEPWTATFIDSAYKRGVNRAFIDARKKKLAGMALEGAKSFFLEGSPERLQKVKMLSLRALELLRGMSLAMGSQLNVILADGLANGQSPRAIAREMVKKVGLTYSRALTIARTEIIHAHAEGQLDSFQELGVEGVGIMAEWSTAGDDKVCSLCATREGEVLTIEDARGLIPLHPNCRCAWIPAEEVQNRERLKKKARKFREA